MAKKKVVDLKSKKELFFPPGDLRNDMTMEEIEIFAQQEKAQIDRHLSMMAKNAPLPSPVEVDTEEDETEMEVELDFKNGIAKEKVAEGILVRGEYDEELLKKVLASAEPLKPFSPYLDLIGDTLVKKAINSLVKKMEKDKDALDRLSRDAHLISVRQALYKQSEKLWDDIRDLKKSIVWSTGFTGSIDYKLIPEWAVVYIQDYISDGLNKVFSLLDD